MPSRCASSGLDGAIGRPSSSTVPASGRSTPVSSLISVDLPAPFWPISAWISPARRHRPAPSSATVAPKRLRRPCACSTWLTATSPADAAARAGTGPACGSGDSDASGPGSVLAVGQFGLGLVLGEHALLHHHAPGHFAPGVHVADQLRQPRAEQRVAFDRGVELAGLHRLERAAHAVGRPDAGVAAGLEEGLHHFLALGPGEVAALRADDHETVIALDDLLEPAHAVVGRRRADRALQFDDPDRARLALAVFHHPACGAAALLDEVRAD